LVKRDQVDPVAALQGVSDILDLSIVIDAAVAVPEEATEQYTIEGAAGVQYVFSRTRTYLPDFSWLFPKVNYFSL
jgi:hypothetical protein